MKSLTESFNKASVAKGETFSVELEALPGAGYEWEVSVVSGKAALVAKGYAPENDRDLGRNEGVGGSVRQLFLFEAQEAGELRIKADYRRSWESGPPLKSRTFNVTVRP